MNMNNFNFKHHKQEDAFKYAMDAIQKSELYPYLQKIILFGSCARGEETENSDIDLLLVFSEDIKNVPRYLKLYRILRSMATSDELYDAEADLKFCIGDDWITSDATIYRCIRKDGVVVWKRN